MVFSLRRLTGAADREVLLGPSSTTRLAFASSKDDQPAGLSTGFDWSVVLDRKPHAFIWGGDAIDSGIASAPTRSPDVPGWMRMILPDVPLGAPEGLAASPAHLRWLYDTLKDEPGYRALRGNVSLVFGTWNERDYGAASGDRHHPYRAAAQSEFLDFLDAPRSDARRRRGGVYGSTLLSAGAGHERSVLLIALDMRFSKDPYSRVGGDFLGEEQWTWLETTLSASAARVHVLISSLQLLPTGREAYSECWNDFPEARDRLLRLLIRLRVKAPVILSGDVHYAELMEARCGDAGDPSAWGWWLSHVGLSNAFGMRKLLYGATLVELTSSGLTRGWGGGGASKLTVEGRVYLTFAETVAQWIYPWRYQTREGALVKRHYFLGDNFGEVQIDWDRGLLTARALRATDGSTAFERDWSLEELDMLDNAAPPVRPCIPHRGEASPLFRFSACALLILICAAPLAAKPLVAIAIGRLLVNRVGRPLCLRLLGRRYKHRLPNLLTAARVAAVPLLAVAFTVPHLHWLVTLLFGLCSTTDWLDGFLARRWKVRAVVLWGATCLGCGLLGCTARVCCEGGAQLALCASPLAAGVVMPVRWFDGVLPMGCCR